MSVWLSLIVSLLFGLANVSFAYEKEIRQLAGQINEGVSKSGVKTVGVLDFTDLEGRVTGLGRFLAEEFSVSLAEMAKGFEVVDRTHLRVLMAEHKLSATGIIDPSTARRLGQIAALEVVVTGTLTSFGESVRLAVKGLNAESAKIIVAATADIPRTKAIGELDSRPLGSIVNQPPGDQPRAPQPSEPKPPPVPSGPKAQWKDVVFEVQWCVRKFEEIQCSIIVESQQMTHSITVDTLSAPATRAIDERGNQYIPLLSFGTRWVQQDGTQLAPGAPARLLLRFSDVPQDRNIFSAVVLAFYFTGGGWEKAQLTLRHVRISAAAGR
jgi:hypothetical protein